jgi:hypothetical protein
VQFDEDFTEIRTRVHRSAFVINSGTQEYSATSRSLEKAPVGPHILPGRENQGGQKHTKDSKRNNSPHPRASGLRSQPGLIREDGTPEATVRFVGVA